MNRPYFDEKQLIDRGKAFQSGFITAMITLLLVFLVTDTLGVSLSRYTTFLICLWLPLGECMVALILKDAYVSVNGAPGRVVMAVFAAAGLLLLALTAAHLMGGQEALLEDGAVTDTAGHLFTGVCMTAVSVVYWVRQHQIKQKFDRS
jgi:hypothetical protein